eukprot:542674_1
MTTESTGSLPSFNSFTLTFTQTIDTRDDAAAISGYVTTDDERTINFEGVEVLGTGSFGTVCTVNVDSSDIDLVDKQCVAKYSGNIALISEGVMLKKLTQDNICPFIPKWLGHTSQDEHEIGDSVFILMEFGGESVPSRMKKLPNKRFDERAARNIIRQILLALEHCHSRGIVHCDVKPANCLINEKNQVKLCDYSISHHADEETSRLSATWLEKNKIQNIDGKHNGTYRYVAPEVVLTKVFCKKADVFGAATSTIYLLTGQPPKYSCPEYEQIIRVSDEESLDHEEQFLLANTPFRFNIDAINCSAACKWWLWCGTRVNVIFRWSVDEALKSNFILTVDIPLIKCSEFKAESLKTDVKFKNACSKVRTDAIKIFKYCKTHAANPSNVQNTETITKNLWDHVINVCDKSKNKYEPYPVNSNFVHYCAAMGECVKGSKIPEEYTKYKKLFKSNKFDQHYGRKYHEKEMMPIICPLMCGKPHKGNCSLFKRRISTYRTLILTKFDEKKEVIEDQDDEKKEEIEDQDDNEEKNNNMFNEAKDNVSDVDLKEKYGSIGGYLLRIFLRYSKYKLDEDVVVSNWKNSKYNNMTPIEIRSEMEKNIDYNNMTKIEIRSEMEKNIDKMVDVLKENLHETACKNLAEVLAAIKNGKKGNARTKIRGLNFFICKDESKKHKWEQEKMEDDELIEQWQNDKVKFICQCCRRFDFWHSSNWYYCVYCNQERCLVCIKYPEMNIV